MTKTIQKNAILSVVVGLLSLLLLYQSIALFLPNPARQKDRVTLAPSLPISAAIVEVSRDSTLYQLIKARPIFSASRRPIPELSEASASSVPALTLVGILDAQSQSFAVARMPGNPNLVLLERGTIIQGWTVTNIERGRVTLQTGHMTQIFTLQRGNND